MASMEEVLVSLHGSAAYNGQQEAWEGDLENFEGRKADDEDELRRVRAEAYQVATLYAMFQGVIFTAVSQPHLLTCALWWSPVFLSLSVSAATLLAIADKLYSMGELQEDINESDRNISVLLGSLDSIKDYGTSLDLDSAQPIQEIPRSQHAGLHRLGSGGGILVLLLIAGFSIHMAMFSLKTLCRSCPMCSV